MFKDHWVTHALPWIDAWMPWLGIVGGGEQSIPPPKRKALLVTVWPPLRCSSCAPVARTSTPPCSRYCAGLSIIPRTVKPHQCGMMMSRE